MKTNLVKCNTIALIFMMASLSLTACDKGVSTAPGTPTSRVDQRGPGDSGGGNICNGKMIESYRVEVTEMPEFKQYLAPILEKLGPQKDRKETGSPFILTAQSKNWYFIDCALDQVPKETNGLYFETHQVAVHRTHEIFVDGRLLNTMAVEERAKLYLHEMVMSFYLMKYVTLEDLCKMSMKCEDSFMKASKWKLFAPLPYKPLNDIDHQKIRAVTAWLWENRETITPAEFSKFVVHKDFDKRFQIAQDDQKYSQVSVDPVAIVRSLKRYQWTKSFPKFCKFDEEQSTSQSLCEVSIQADIRTSSNPMPSWKKEIYLSVKIVRKSDGKVLEREFFLPLVEEKLSLFKSKIGNVVNASAFAALSSWPNFPGVDIKVGTQSAMLMVLMDLTKMEEPEIYQIQYETFVWYDIEEVFVERNGQRYKDTYGYRASLLEESETIFAESTLPFFMRLPATSRDMIKTELVPASAPAPIPAPAH